jgi:hypothetical protein
MRAMARRSPPTFTDEADLVVWDGTHLKERQQIASFNWPGAKLSSN